MGKKVAEPTPFEKTSVEQSPALPVTPYSWQQEPWQHIQNLIGRQRIPHAMLLSGSPDIGKLRFAQAVAQRMLCPTPLIDSGCGRCKQCQLLTSNTHPDLLLLEPEEAGKSIKIDQIRQLDKITSNMSQQGGWKIVIINPAEAMNINAANALLKSLEEPGQNTLLMLISSEMERIPATVRSRCQILKFNRPDPEKVRLWLSQVAGETTDIPSLMNASNGRPLLALKLLQTDTMSRQKHFTELLNGIWRGEESTLAVANWCKDEKPLQVVAWMQALIQKRLKETEDKGVMRLLFRFSDKLVENRRRLQSASNPNLQLLLEELMLDWQAMAKAVKKQ